MEIAKYQKPIGGIAKASKPHETVKIVEFDNNEISLAIKTDLPIRSYEQNAFVMGLITIINRLRLNAGSRIDDDAEVNMNEELKKKIIRKYSHFTLKEIDLAFQNGIDGDYGEYYGLNVATCMKFLGAYSKIRSKHLTKLQLQRDVDRIAKETEMFKNQHVKDISKQIRIELTDMLVHSKTEWIKGNFLTFKRHIYKKCYVDVLEHKNQMYARKMGAKAWLKVENIEKVKEYLIKNG